MSHHTTPSAKPVQWLKAMALLVLLVLAHASALAQSTVTFFHNDIAGTPLAATDSAGNLVWKETYRPYGERLTHSSASSTNSVWFTSKPQDPHTGLVYMGARYYDPVIGRFMGTDPVGFVQSNVHSVNRYAYANNNPYRFVDPDGNLPILLVIPLAVKAADFALTGVELYAAYQTGGMSALAMATAENAAWSVVPGAKTGKTLYRYGHSAGNVADAAKEVVINAQKQAGHVPGTPQNINRIKQGKPTSSFHGEQSGEMATRIAHERGTPVLGRPNVKEHDFGVGIGTGPNGGTQTRVRVHESPKTGEIHGHPSGPERF